MLAAACVGLSSQLQAKYIEEHPIDVEGTNFYLYPNGILPDGVETPAYNIVTNNGLYPEAIEKVAVMRGKDPRINNPWLNDNVEVPEFVCLEGEFYRVMGIDGAFSSFKGKSVEIPDAVSYIGDNSFSHAESLEKLVLPASLKLIGENALTDMTGLKDLYFRSVVPPVCRVNINGTVVEVSALENSDIEIPAESALLKGTECYVYVPKGSRWAYSMHPCFKGMRLVEYEPEYVGASLAEGQQTGVSSYYCTGNLTLQQLLTYSVFISQFYGIGYESGLSLAEHPYRITSIRGTGGSDIKVKKIALPRYLEMVCDNSLCGFSVEEIVIPASVRYIGQRSFENIKNLKSVALYTPESGEKIIVSKSAFSGSIGEVVLYVDKNTTSIDLTEAPWNKFKEIRDISER